MDTPGAIPAEDLEYICAREYLPWEELKGKTVLITGATGLVGYTLTSALLYADRARALGMTVLALVRDLERARRRFEDQLRTYGAPGFLIGDVERLPVVDGPVDYIIHGAGPTASKTFVRQPVETLRTAALGTLNMLALAREKRAGGFVYLSSMEVYGQPQQDRKVRETEPCRLVPQTVRGSYPIGKLQAESMCCAYAAEYGVPAKVVRLAQVFGPGAHPDDTRIFAACARCIREGRDIVLRTRGEAAHSYLYTADAATALLTVLLRGAPGEIYNAADERTYCSIADMVRQIAEENGVGVRYEPGDSAALGYPDAVRLELDASRLRDLGWTPGEQRKWTDVLDAAGRKRARDGR